MRARSRLAFVLVFMLFLLCVRVWADAPRPQAAPRVYLPLIVRGSALPGPTPGASPSATVTSRATSTPTPTLQVCGSVPRLIAPANGALLDTLCPLVRVDAGNQLNATHLELQMSTDSGFGLVRFRDTRVAQLGLNEFQVQRNLEAGAQYFWRVRLRCGEANAPWSEVWSFTSGSGGTLPPAPGLTSPISGTLLTSWPVRLSWSAVASALEYQALWRKASLPMMIYSVWTGETNTTGWDLEPSTVYEWSVSARNAYGVGPASAWWQFTTPSTQPAPQDVLPIGGQLVIEQEGRGVLVVITPSSSTRKEDAGSQ